MKYEFSAKEARVIGCMLEKQITTPEQYPLSLNSLTTACNQKTNREPVMELSESEVQQTLDLLLRKHIIRSLSGSRTMKYEHRFCNSEFGNLKFSPAEVAVISTLLLRGAQTPGELRTRTNRLHDFADVAEVELTLNTLAGREDGPFCVRLAREPGKRESRYMHLFSGEVSDAAGEDEIFSPASSQSASRDELAERVNVLETEVAELKERLEHLLERLAD
ncbi:YceH family protein [Rouxiella badensis]|uniref:YceH family protein n=1 Tax=Rouxiella badensis TaxID=1646377 RepID=UPI001788468B|nr:YceH family protein [Rouxiella badensis]QOI54689.1 YceH family protein [Rouxiella badensis subsp. acadiensis]